MINILKTKFTKEFELLEKELKNILNSKPTDFDVFFDTFLFKDAKRLRVILIFLICDFLNKEIDENIIKYSCAIEFLHSASLIHDDMLDDGQIRRGEPCLHIENGVKKAILAGDYLLSLSMDSISKINKPKLVEILADTSYKMTKSEINSFINRKKPIKLNSYIQILKDKTSSLFLASIYGVQEIKNIKIDKKLFDFVENFSLCFQIKDDINNFTKQDKNKTSSDKDNGIYTLVDILKEEKGKDCDIIYEARKFLTDLIEETKNTLQDYESNKTKDLFLLLDLLKG